MNKKESMQPWSFIDWKSQWESHGLNFQDGYVHVDIPEAISTPWKLLKLTPGAGFGDLSHPTTRLVLRMLNRTIANQYVVDIGCGSGVLALCAIALGAKHVFALDIDEGALMHSQENARLNGMADRLTCFLPNNFQISSFVKAPIILMNMILSEQKNAWSALTSLHQNHGICMTSGILLEQRQAYLEMTECWGWNFCSEEEEKGWSGFKFH